MLALAVHRAIAILCLAAPAQGCCGDPANTPVDPDCPGGIPASASLTMQLAPANLRPIGSPKQIRVRGNRLDTSPCIAAGAQSSFSTELREPSPLTASQPGLAPGAWRFTITALSGGDYAPVEVNRPLAAGGTAAMSINGNAANELQVGF